MFAPKKALMMIGCSLIATGAIACKGEPVDTEETTSSITKNTQAMSASIGASAQMLAESSLFLDGWYAYDGGGDYCYTDFDEQGNDIEVCESPEPTEPDFQADIDAGTEAVVTFLEDSIFTEANLEEERRRQLTFLLRGSEVCRDLKDSYPADYSECVSVVDDAEVRLVVTSPQEGDISIDLLVSSKRYNPFSIDIWSDTLAVEFGLGDIKDTIKYTAGLFGEDVDSEFPDMVRGRARLALKRPSSQKLTASLSVLQAIEISDADDGYDVRVSAADPAVRTVVDLSAKSLTHEVKWAAIDATFPFEETIYETSGDGEGINYDAEPVDVREHSVKIDLAGLTGTAIFDITKDVLDFSNIGLGPDTMTVDIDSERVFELDVNPNDGRAFDMSIAAQGDDIQVTFAPAVEIAALFQFARIVDKFDDTDFEDWTLDERLVFSFTGNSPTLLVKDDSDEIEVVRGQLSLTADQRNISVNVAANQCLVDGYPDASVGCDTDGSGSTNCSDPVEYDDHPFAYIEAGMCE